MELKRLVIIRNVSLILMYLLIVYAFLSGFDVKAIFNRKTTFSELFDENPFVFITFTILILSIISTSIYLLINKYDFKVSIYIKIIGKASGLAFFISTGLIYMYNGYTLNELSNIMYLLYALNTATAFVTNIY